MGTLADSLFNVLMSWVRGLVSGLWALFSSDHTTALAFLGKNWMLIAAVLIAAGLVIDWIIWLLRWQPYHLWAQRARRLLGIEEPEDEEEEAPRAHAAEMPQRRIAYEEPDDDPDAPQADELPLHIDERDAQQVIDYARTAPDERAYPGMRYDSEAPQELGSTQRYGAVTQEGPGAAEVERRRAEIAAWQQQMQEEARARAEAERAEREAEQARLAQEAYEAEQARLAQEQYERELAEYEAQKAQYERELAEYERQKAAYEAEQARLAQEAYEAEQARLAQEAYEAEQAQAMQETAEEIAPPRAGRRRRGKTYSDYIEGEAAEALPDAPAWPQMEEAHAVQADRHEAHKKAGSALLSRMAKMIEPEEEELAARTKLPPRVNMQDAYRPAAEPRRSGRRSGKA